MYDDLTFLQVKVDGGVAVVTLGGASKANTYDARGHRELADIWERLAEDDRVSAVVLTGAGRYFSAGPTADWMVELTQDPKARNDAFRESMLMANRCIDFEKPVITAMNGLAHGAALAFALFADIVIMEGHLTIQDGHVRAGLTAGDGGTLLWPLSMGLTKAKRYLLTGDPVTAEDAERMGLVTEVVRTGASLERALTYAHRFAAGPATAIRSTKRSLNQWLRSGSLVTLQYAWSQEIISMATPEAAQAAANFGAGLMPPDIASGTG